MGEEEERKAAEDSAVWRWCEVVELYVGDEEEGDVEEGPGNTEE